MKKYLKILKKCPLFESIEEESLLRMLTCLGARVELFDKKYTIMAENVVILNKSKDNILKKE